MALLAMGFAGPEENTVFTALEIGHNGGNRLVRDLRGRAAPGVYVCGDAATGPGLVVWAIADGLMTADTLLADCGSDAGGGAPGLTRGRRRAVCKRRCAEDGTSPGERGG